MPRYYSVPESANQAALRIGLFRKYRCTSDDHPKSHDKMRTWESAEIPWPISVWPYEDKPANYCPGCGQAQGEDSGDRRSAESIFFYGGKSLGLPRAEFILWAAMGAAIRLRRCRHAGCDMLWNTVEFKWRWSFRRATETQTRNQVKRTPRGIVCWDVLKCERCPGNKPRPEPIIFESDTPRGKAKWQNLMEGKEKNRRIRLERRNRRNSLT